MYSLSTVKAENKSNKLLPDITLLVWGVIIIAPEISSNRSQEQLPYRQTFINKKYF